MTHGIADKIIDLLGEKQTQLGAAAQRFFGEENIGPARATADREVAAADFPLLELLGDFRANSLRLAQGKAWRLPIRLVDHVPAANHDLVETRRTMRKFLQSLLKQRCDWLHCFWLVAE